MKMRLLTGIVLCLVVVLAIVVKVQAQELPRPKMPAGHPHSAMGSEAKGEMEVSEQEIREMLRKQDRTEFEKEIKLEKLRLLAVQHRDQVKIMDSWARQSLAAITNRQAFGGKDPLYTALDMTFRKELWDEEDIVYVRDVPVRMVLARMVSDEKEKKRIMSVARVKPAFLNRPEVQQALQVFSQETVAAQSAGRVDQAEVTFENLFQSMALTPPSASLPREAWMHPLMLGGNIPEYTAQMAEMGQKLTPVAGYTSEADVNAARQIVEAMWRLRLGWRLNNVAMANQGIEQLAAVLPTLNNAAYPSETTRKLEWFYNRTFNGTLVVIVYFVAFILFAIAAVGGMKRVRWGAMAFFTLAVACHVAAMGARWWIAGRIPIQNQFESVLGAALLGCVAALVAELWSKRNFYGMAMSFVGMLAMTACFVFPFVMGVSIGENISPTAGILSNTVWLYIHVNVVIFSYALIAAGAKLGGAYLLHKLWYWIKPVEVLGYAPHQQNNEEVAKIQAARAAKLQQLDVANVVVLQSAFWFLGVGILLGAVWADVSWGRPWGWDPKETFALVTWIVYLLIIHLRFVTPRNRATLTAILAVVGFFIMLFNWIGVNFLLVGLHSYA